MKLVIEHLYPTSIGRWVHFKLLGESSNSMRIKQQHSRTVEHRVEVIPGILYIHMISQLVDNICYLIVYQDYSKPKMQGIVIDCGDAKALLHMIERIHRQHYHDHPAIEVTSVLCTHKHHDHTAGNKQILKAFPDVKVCSSVCMLAFLVSLCAIHSLYGSTRAPLLASYLDVYLLALIATRYMVEQ